MRKRLNSQLRKFEGSVKEHGRHVVYDDSLGVPTIAYGRNLRHRGLSESEARFLLSNDIDETVADVNERLPWVEDMNGPRRAVVYDMAFNMGMSSFLGFRNTLRAMKRGKYRRASKRMLKSLWADQVGYRADELSDQMRTGKWQT